MQLQISMKLQKEYVCNKLNCASKQKSSDHLEYLPKTRIETSARRNQRWPIRAARFHKSGSGEL